MEICRRLKGKYYFLLSVLPFTLMFGAFVPIWFISIALASALGIPLVGVPVKDHPNDALFITIFLGILVLLLITGFLLGSLLNAVIMHFVRGWPWSKLKEIFIFSQVPASWFEESLPSIPNNYNAPNLRKKTLYLCAPIFLAIVCLFVTFAGFPENLQNKEIVRTISFFWLIFIAVCSYSSYLWIVNGNIVRSMNVNGSLMNVILQNGKNIRFFLNEIERVKFKEICVADESKALLFFNNRKSITITHHISGYEKILGIFEKNGFSVPKKSEEKKIKKLRQFLILCGIVNILSFIVFYLETKTALTGINILLSASILSIVYVYWLTFKKDKRQQEDNNLS